MSTEQTITVVNGKLRARCIFCERDHEAEYYDELDKQFMACRDRVSPRKRGDLAAYDPEEFNHFTITTESLIPR